MEQQCPICMLYLLPGMNLQDHLDTHPKDMIIKALLAVKPEPPKQEPSEMATVFLTTPFNSSPAHIYQPQSTSIQNSFALAKRSSINNINNNSNNNNLFGNRPYRLTLDAQQAVSTPTATATFLNTSAVATTPNNFGRRCTSTNDGDLFSDGKAAAAFRCIQQNTEQKNIMIVNTSSTQFSIQQTVPVKKPTTAAIELHPVIIENSTLPLAASANAAISIIPRYTSEKYSGPPPSYESSITNTINDKPRVIDLTQTPTTSSMAMKIMEKQCIGSGINNNNNKMNTATLSNSSNGGDEKRHLMITTGPQKVFEYTQTENGDVMITEKLLSPDESSASLNVSHEEEIVEELNENNYNLKYVHLDQPIAFNDERIHKEENSFTIIEESEVNESQRAAENDDGGKKKSIVKVISNVKLTSAEMLSPTIKDIIQQYNSNQSSADMQIDQFQVIDVNESDTDNEDYGSSGTKEAKSDDTTASLIQCTETLNLSKDKSDGCEIACTSVIRKATNDAKDEEEQEPSTSTAEYSRKPISVVFNSNSTNRLKNKEIYKQPKKLVVKLKKPLQSAVTSECSVKSQSEAIPLSVKSENAHEEYMEATTSQQQMDKKKEQFEQNKTDLSTSNCKVESSEQFTVTFLDHHHDYESISKITITPEIHHDSETNQSLLSMDLEPETSAVKREEIDGEIPIIVKTEMNSCSASSLTSNSQSSSCSRSPGPSGVNIESVASINENSPINFLYQNDRVRFSPPLSPYVYMKTFSSSEDQPKQETDVSWNNSNSLVTQNSDQNSTCSRYTPSFDDNRSNYTDLDINAKTSRIDIRAPSADSLNIRTDEKMPARGEISEQESNGEIEQPWHHPYFQLQAYPSSYDMSTAQECWNLSKADSQNACDTNNIQNVIINFPPLNGQEDIKTPDLLKTIMQTVTKQEPVSINDEASGSSSNVILKKSRSFRCPECSRIFTKLRARNRHMEQDHPHLRRTKKLKPAPTATQTSKSESSVFAAASTSSTAALVNWTASSASQQEHEVKVLSIIKNEPSTSAAVLVKNEMNRMLISTTGSIKMEMDRLLLEPSTSSTSQQISTLGLKIKRTYMCAKCNEQFRTLKLLDKHFQIHPAECTLCQKTFNSWNTFSLHLKHHLNIRVHACRYCPKRFVQRQRLVEHERIHTGHMPIKCPDCDERFRRYSNMLHHRARVHLNKKAKQEDYVCDCGEIFQTKAKLEWHQETHENKPKPCPYCRERFTHRNSLTRHIRLSHTEKYVFVKSKAVNCPICNCTYLPSSIKAHMATHQISNKEFSCSICSKQFSTKWNLKQHHWTHANRSSKPFQCNLCPSAFVRETDYTTHMNAHRSIKPFTCNTCGKRFVRKYNWLRHSREHEREKKFTCEICNKKFHRAYYLTEHKRVHTGERPFSCTICGKTSATKTNHNKHIKIHHARDPLTAEG